MYRNRAVRISTYMVDLRLRSMNKVSKEIVACCSLVWISSSLYTFHRAADLSVFDMVFAGYLLGYFQQRIQNRRMVTIKGMPSAILVPKGNLETLDATLYGASEKTSWPAIQGYHHISSSSILHPSRSEKRNIPRTEHNPS